MATTGIRPTILIPGFTGGRHILQPFRDKLRARGIAAECWPKAPFVYRRPIGWYAERLGTSILESGDRDITLVGWSMGGFVSVAAALDPAVSIRIRRIITFGTPWDGTWAARIGLVTDRVLRMNVREMRPGAATLKELVDFLRSGPRAWSFQAINGRYDILARAPQKCLRLEWCQTGPWNHLSILWQPGLFDLIHRLIVLS